MNRQQQSKMRMYQSVRRLLENNPTAWANIPAYADAFGRFTGSIDLILVTNTEQRTAITGHALERKRVRRELNVLLLQISGALTGLARKTNNPVLLHNAHVVPSTLGYAGESSHQALRNRILTEANLRLAELADFGITQGHIAVLEAKIVEYELLVVQPRMAILERRKRTERMKDLFEKADGILRGEMDPMLALIAVQDAELASAYKSARNIIPFGTRSSTSSDVDIGDGDGV